ncbi:MAG: serine/threonine-protein kinase, partial [Caulobacteraceae bacterium]
MSTPYHNKALPEGTILREWRLEHILGAGGFGIVYRARGVYFDELVAIKEYFPSAISDRRNDSTVAPNDTSSEEIYALGLQKFLEEAKVLWNLSKPERHPNIVSVRSLFEIHGTAYMVMDFESGVSLSQMLKDGRKFTEDELMGLIKPIAQGLDRAHRAGVLHRDIKPANILVDDTGRPVLIDFGSARFDSGQATSTKVTFYTPPYAAIEQYVRTYPQGPWTDIYALGVALYQCVTGEKPPEVLERLHGGLGESLSSKERPGFSRAFTRAVDAAMAIRPGERPQSISKWLALFDEPEPEEDDPSLEATSIAASALDPPTMVRPMMDAAPVEAPQPPSAKPAAKEAVANAAVAKAPVEKKPPPPAQPPMQTAVEEPAAPPQRAPPWRWAAIAAVVVVGGGGAAWLLRPAPITGPTTAAAPATPGAGADGSSPGNPAPAPVGAAPTVAGPLGAASPLLAQVDGFIAEAKR